MESEVKNSAIEKSLILTMNFTKMLSLHRLVLFFKKWKQLVVIIQLGHSLVLFPQGFYPLKVLPLRPSLFTAHDLGVLPGRNLSKTPP